MEDDPRPANESISSEDRFARGLAGFFTDPGVRKMLADQARRSFRIGDGTDVVIGDYVRIPSAVGGRRAGQVATVVQLSNDGLGLRFEEKIAGITREFFEWSDLMDADARAAPRDRKRTSVTPPRHSGK